VWCQTYCSERVVTAQLPARWYREHMVVGADAHGLPAYWIAMLRQLRCA
jgi:hypothetical protein